MASPEHDLLVAALSAGGAVLTPTATPAGDALRAMREAEAAAGFSAPAGTILGPVVGTFADEVDGHYGQAMKLMGGLVRKGQSAGEIRAGDPRALAHLASVLTNEFVLADLPLTRAEFHAVLDGALRASESVEEEIN